MAQSGKGLTGRPMESEPPGAEINHLQEQQSLPKQQFALHIFQIFVTL
ncbi:hypothetical protein [Fictibacillus phosphorivorans]|nr:hypothetical protein [Fictibacillus phosphorivorans]